MSAHHQRNYWHTDILSLREKRFCAQTFRGPDEGPVPELPDPIQEPNTPSDDLNQAMHGDIDVPVNLAETVDPESMDRAQQFLQTKANVAGELTLLSGEAEKSLNKESMQLKDIWDGMGGVEKLVAILAIGYAVIKKPTLAAWAVGGYWAWKIIARDPAPLQTIANAGQGLLDNTVRKWNDAGWHGAQQDVPLMGEKDMVLRAGAIANYLEKNYQDYDNEYTTEVKGMVMLGDKPIDLKMLASSFQTDGDPERSYLDVARGTPLDAALKKQYGKSYEGIRAYFDNEKKIGVLSEGITYLLLAEAVAHPPNDAAKKDVEILKNAMGGRLDQIRFEKLQTSEAKNAFRSLVLQGQLLWLNRDNDTLIYWFQNAGNLNISGGRSNSNLMTGAEAQRGAMSNTMSGTESQLPSSANAMSGTDKPSAEQSNTLSGRDGQDANGSNAMPGSAGERGAGESNPLSGRDGKSDAGANDMTGRAPGDNGDANPMSDQGKVKSPK